MIKVDRVDYDDISDKVRKFCAERLYELEKSLRPMIDGSFGEVLPGHLNAYLVLLRQLGALYQTHKPPRDLQQLIPASKVQELLARMEERRVAELELVVAATEERVRRELAQGSERSVQSAQETVLTKLLELESRASRHTP